MKFAERVPDVELLVPVLLVVLELSDAVLALSGLVDSVLVVVLADEGDDVHVYMVTVEAGGVYVTVTKLAQSQVD